MYYEIALYDVNGEFHVARPADLGEGWAMDSDLLHEAADGYPIAEISEAELPAPLQNQHYAGLRLFKLDGQHGASYFGIAER